MWNIFRENCDFAYAFNQLSFRENFLLKSKNLNLIFAYIYIYNRRLYIYYIYIYIIYVLYLMLFDLKLFNLRNKEEQNRNCAEIVQHTCNIFYIYEK